MDRFLDLAYHEWPSGVLHPAVSHRKVTKQALEMVGLANSDLCRGGSDSRCVFFWSAIGNSWPDPKSAWDRGLLQHLLQSGSVHHGFSPAPRSGLSSVYTLAPCHRSGASTDQMVRLRCCGIRKRRHSCIHHPSSYRHTPLVRASGVCTQHSLYTSHSYRNRDSDPAL